MSQESDHGHPPTDVDRGRSHRRVRTVISNTTERRIARLRGGFEAERGAPPASCPYTDRPRRAAWMGGYLGWVVSALGNDLKALMPFPVKPRSDWSEPEVELLVQAWPTRLPLRVLAQLLGRSPRAVRCRATRAGLGGRAWRRWAKAAIAEGHTNREMHQ